MRCLLNIWGVMLFLRLSWVIGQAGVGYGIVIICLSNVVTVITSISMSAIVLLFYSMNPNPHDGLGSCCGVGHHVYNDYLGTVNGSLNPGGIYYMISRSLGPEFGGSIGLMFTLSNSVACAMYVVGFCESLLDMLKSLGFQQVIFDQGVNDIRLIGAGTLVLLLLIAFVGMDWVTRTQMILMVVLIAAQINYIVGSFMGYQNDLEQVQGMNGFNISLLTKNMGPQWKADKDGTEQNFFTVFAVFFPAVTGIVAGANLSGDLKDPSVAIPKGTLWAILTTFCTYIMYAVFFGATMFREATGNLRDLPLHNFTNCTLNECNWGLYSPQAMNVAAAWDGLIYAGCFAATLSSAIASLVGAPRVLQALATDKLYPFVGFFAKGYGANNDPVRGYVLCFIIALGCVALGDVNVVATITTSIFLTAYGLINFSVFHATITKSPGWRPSFKYYNAWVSLVGTVMCLLVMFLISWYLALITFGIVIILYLIVIYLKPEVNWGSSTQAQSYVSALKAAQDLLTVEEHVKNYRPQLLVLCGSPSTRPPLVDMANLITKHISLLVIGHVVKPPTNQKIRNALTRKAYSWLNRHKVRAFYSLVEDSDFGRGAKSLYQICGMGRMKPNTVLLGFKGDWQTCSREDVKSYFMAVHDALDMYLAVGILRVPEGLDYCSVVEDEDESPINNVQQEEKIPRNSSGGHLSGNQSTPEATPPGSPSSSRNEKTAADGNAQQKAAVKKRRRRLSASQMYHGPGGSALPKEVLNNLTRFQRKQAKNYIDVWWLYDDGGLTLLIPYIFTTRSQFQSCTLRIFSIANRKDELDREQRNMAALLSKFRIDYSDVIVIPDIGKRAKPESKKEFQNMIEPFMSPEDEETDPMGYVCPVLKLRNVPPKDAITEAELLGLKEKTNRHIRLGELLQQHSKDSNMVVMTLPMPRKGTVSPFLYMAWLETITKNMPPFLIIRGNQTSVLTFYS